MADNLTVFNTDYTGVTGIKAKETGNGILTYIRPQGTKIITENGTVDVSNYMNAEVNVSSGDSENRSNPIRFFDYDGTLVASYTSVPDSLPNVPTHDKLTNGTWNYTLEQISSQYAAVGTCDIGANYDTASGKNEIDVTFDDPNLLSPYLAIAVNGTAIIDWGDGSVTDTITGTSFSTLVFVQHTYAQIGSYTIMVDGTIGFYSNNNSYPSVFRLTNDTSSRQYSQAYSRCMTAVRVANGSRLGTNAFQYCYSLASVSIPESVTSIGAYAFNSCYSLANVSIPDSVTSFSTYAFQYCYTLASVSIPKGVTSIGTYAFQCCYNLASVSIPEGVTSIGAFAFNSCYTLASVSIPKGVTSIGSYAFSGCYSLASVSIPKGVTSIGDDAFQYCCSLTNVTIPNGVTSINTNAFNNCYGLASVSIPESVTSIDNNAFQYCRSLTNVTIPNGVTSINTNAFYNCYSLANVSIPESVTSIGNNAFYNCYGTYEYHLKSTTPPTLAGRYVFYGIMPDTKIYVPAGSLEVYKTATNWSTYAKYMIEE